MNEWMNGRPQVCSGLDWMCFFDVVNHDIQQSQNYTMMAYLPFTFVAIHFQLAAVLHQKIKFPVAQTEVSSYFFFLFVCSLCNVSIALPTIRWHRLNRVIDAMPTISIHGLPLWTIYSATSTKNRFTRTSTRSWIKINLIRIGWNRPTPSWTRTRGFYHRWWKTWRRAWEWPTPGTTSSLTSSLSSCPY